jgi:hypothetical protein
VHVHETTLAEGAVRDPSGGVAWIAENDLRDFGVSSMTRKALASGSALPRRSPRSQRG